MGHSSITARVPFVVPVPQPRCPQHCPPAASLGFPAWSCQPAPSSLCVVLPFVWLPEGKTPEKGMSLKGGCSVALALTPHPKAVGVWGGHHDPLPGGTTLHESPGDRTVPGLVRELHCTCYHSLGGTRGVTAWLLWGCLVTGAGPKTCFARWELCDAPSAWIPTPSSPAEPLWGLSSCMSPPDTPPLQRPEAAPHG